MLQTISTDHTWEEGDRLQCLYCIIAKIDDQSDGFEGCWVPIRGSTLGVLASLTTASIFLEVSPLPPEGEARWNPTYFHSVTDMHNYFTDIRESLNCASVSSSAHLAPVTTYTRFVLILLASRFFGHLVTINPISILYIPGSPACGLGC